MRNRYWTTLALPFFCLVAMGVAKGAPRRAPKDAKTLTVEEMTERREVLNEEVMELTRPLTCKSNKDCATLEMGTKPCGGPWKYVLFSKKNKKVSALKKKITDYNKIDQKINEATQVMSDCMMMLPPEPKCLNKVCTDTAKRGTSRGSQKKPSTAESLAPATDH